MIALNVGYKGLFFIKDPPTFFNTYPFGDESVVVEFVVYPRPPGTKGFILCWT